MPYVHAGVGATIGSVIPTLNAIIPSAVGVDIGCGMCAVQTNLKLSDMNNLYDLRLALENCIPVGFSEHNNLPKEKLSIDLNIRIDNLFNQLKSLEIVKTLNVNVDKIYNQLGTLGGGNHFIELSHDEDNNMWIMLHSGSRGIGNKIGQTAIKLAREHANKNNINLVDKDLAWLNDDTQDFKSYIAGMFWSQEYALLNRDIMMFLALSVIKNKYSHLEIIGEAINCHHNYTSIENFNNKDLYITRKGAVSARNGQLGIIPASMGQKSYIVKGKGNLDSYCSCSHGAGRLMSRTKARNHFTVEDLEIQTAGVECRKDIGVLDEIPQAYKNIDLVMEAQKDLVDIVCGIKPILCIKG